MNFFPLDYVGGSNKSHFFNKFAHYGAFCYLEMLCYDTCMYVCMCS